MANDNETVGQVALSDLPLAEQLRIIRGNYSIGSGEFDALDEAADVVECNQREISRLKGERKGILKANESLAADNTRLRDELAAKDATIAEQSAVNESQAAQLRDALNECEELKCAIADSKRISDAVVKSLRDKNLEMAGEIAAKDAEIEDLKKENARLRVIVSGATVADGNLREEIERLREIVKELADDPEMMICNEIVKSAPRRGK